ncbi:EH domain-binding protein 1 isoform X1 [Oreochromis niloticus]|uniref:Calmin n=1 Tax=Oreochromis niloticus TaxID=8128 RepID=A0A669BZP1_ORENI|nr:EH domain-binding protein 1 isoform X1 [Oreochromis niloticus]XP_019209044.1 EH domain-binding protein 1 isoform X1 [Oreochromis niloticus]
MQDDWDSQTNSASELNDKYTSQDERKAVQKRTFTRWMNVFLQRRDPPIEVHDLFTEIQDGKILMALLEELSGCRLLYRFRSSSHRIFRLNNISKALVFLDDRHVKLLGIDASGIADGKPSVVLHLVWNIILHFQVKEVMGGLQKHLSSSLSSLSMSSYPSSNDLSPQPSDTGTYSCSTLPSKGRKAAREAKYHGKAIKVLLQWVRRCTSKYGVDVNDFGKSWRSGLAFLALVKSINPVMVDLRESFHRDPVENIRQAFMIAHHSLDVPPLLEPEDVTCTSPDEQSIITYVSMFPKCHSGIDEAPTPDTDTPEIPSFGSFESVSFEETHADVPEVQALLKGLGKSSEQLLWKRWSRRSSGSPCSPSFHTNGTATSNQPAGTASDSHYKKRKGSGRSTLQPPSPLDAGIVSQEVRLWSDSGLDQGYGKRRAESCYSLSSEEGIYSLPSLDSDEEDAYSYILELNKDVFLSYNQLKRQVPKVKEETAEEMKEESKYQEGSLLQNADFELESAQSVVHRKFDFDKNERNLRTMTHTGAALDFKPEGESRSSEQHEGERANRGQSNDDGDYCEEERKKKMENAKLFKNGVGKTEDNAEEANVEVARWQEDTEDRRDGELSEKCGQAGGQDLGNESKDAAVIKEDRKIQKSTNSDSFKGEVNGKIITDEASCEVRSDTEGESGRKYKEEKMRDTDEVINSAEFVKTAAGEEGPEITTTTTEHDGEESPRTPTLGGICVHDKNKNWPPACSPTPQSPSRDEGSILQPLAASCGVTLLELEMLFVWWILLYCCLILRSQMNL